MRPASGMGLAQIPIDKIEWYAQRYYLEPLELTALETVIRMVDVDYIKRNSPKPTK